MLLEDQPQNYINDLRSNYDFCNLTGINELVLKIVNMLVISRILKFMRHIIAHSSNM